MPVPPHPSSGFPGDIRRPLPDGRLDTSFLILLALVLASTRWWSHAHLLLHDDSINFIRALTVFDLAANSPHPPGYIWFVLMARSLNSILVDGLAAYLLVNFVMQGLVLVAVYSVIRDLLDPWSAFWAAMTVLLHPLFWYYGSVTLAYTADAAAFMLVGWALHKHGWMPSTHSAVVLGLMWGLVGGIRQFSALLMFPVVVWQLFVHRREAKPVPVMLAMLAGVGIWLVPLLSMSGGWDTYSTASREALSYYLFSRSPLFTADANWVFYNIARWLMAMFQILWPLCPFLILMWIGAKRWRGVNHRREGTTLLRWVLLIAPALAFYLIVYIAQSGYLLAMLSPLVIVAGVVASRTRDLRLFRKCAGAAAICGGLFFAVAPASHLRLRSAQPASYYLSPSNLGDVLSRIYRYQADFTLSGLRKSEAITRGYLAELAQCNPDSTLIVFNHERDLVWSILHFYAPEFSMVRRNWKTGEWECLGNLCDHTRLIIAPDDTSPSTLEVSRRIERIIGIDDTEQLDSLRVSSPGSGKWHKGLIVINPDRGERLGDLVFRRNLTLEQRGTLEP